MMFLTIALGCIAASYGCVASAIHRDDLDRSRLIILNRVIIYLTDLPTSVLTEWRFYRGTGDA